MPKIILETVIKANQQIVFDLSRSIDFHKISAKQTKEEAIAGVTSGLISLGESVTWKAKHFGFYQVLTSKITEMNEPSMFVDEMVVGIFKNFEHRHLFSFKSNATVMIDEFNYTSPLGVLGRIADYMFLKRYMERFLKRRNYLIKECAESDAWKSILNHL